MHLQDKGGFEELEKERIEVSIKTKDCVHLCQRCREHKKSAPKIGARYKILTISYKIQQIKNNKVNYQKFEYFNTKL